MPWSCSQCTLVNDSSLIVCDVCGLSKTASDVLKMKNSNFRNDDDDDDDDTDDQRNLLKSSISLTTIENEGIDQNNSTFETLDNLVAQCVNSKTKFSDSEFNSSAIQLPADVTLNDCVWLRPSEQSNAKCAVFANGAISPLDVKQGRLGVCWLLSALAVLAERRPEIILRNVVTKEYSAEGVYLVRLCVNGLWQNVIVDDRFLCLKRTRKTLYASLQSGLWVALIEKACAKVLGGYAALAGGLLENSFKMLTGVATECVRLDESQLSTSSMYEKIRAALAEKLVVCASTSSSDEFELLKHARLSAGHAYSLLDCKLLNNQKLILLHDPWGRCAYSLSHEFQQQFNEEQRRALSASIVPGSFWITASEFLSLFEEINICLARDDWFPLRYKIPVYKNNYNNKHNPIRIATKSLCITLLSAETTSTVLSATTCNPAALRKVGFVLLRQRDDGTHEYCDAAMGRGSVHKSLELIGNGKELSQKYLLHSFAINTPNQQQQQQKSENDSIVITLHSSQPLLIERTEADSNDFKFLHAAICNSIDSTVSKLGERRLLAWGGGTTLLLLFDNVAARRNVKVELLIREEAHTSRNSLLIQDVVPAHASQILNVVATVSSKQQSYQITMIETNESPQLLPTTTLFELHSPLLSAHKQQHQQHSFVPNFLRF